MNHQLISIVVRSVGPDNIPTASARELHAFLGVGKDFSNWIKNQIARARLVENRDFLVFAEKGENPKGGRPTLEYYLTIDAGKHIAMMSGTDKGFEVRDYFLECERQARKAAIDPMRALNDPAMMRRLLLTYSEKVLTLQAENAVLVPKADALDRIATADGSLCITDAAKALQVQPRKVFAVLQEHKWIYRRVGCDRWIAYQDKLQQQLLVHKTTTVSRSNGSEKIIEQVRITPKGLSKLALLFQGGAA
jgi:phage anti-repressor protein